MSEPRAASIYYGGLLLHLHSRTEGGFLGPWLRAARRNTTQSTLTPEALQIIDYVLCRARTQSMEQTPANAYKQVPNRKAWCSPSPGSLRRVGGNLYANSHAFKRIPLACMPLNGSPTHLACISTGGTSVLKPQREKKIMKKPSFQPLNTKHRHKPAPFAQAQKRDC